ncbi:oligosaccharide flippase family protein [Simiduia sp. 21SJ11W-1]|uniref:oligosaccharide flippase family protein n=1 Tax=Simiduia sp. 21SJ11W-1 TaxID=2909669 RepID=UPI0020A00836|nr:oligosaccharide flippase family protein [Simiduia sp. 21SJ11W-1]UTA47372.1 oligosaccharide flippase family protein [Simiduia sp. 21SJ11W-1]
MQLSTFSLFMRGSSFRVLQTLVGIAIGFLMMPFLIGALGKEVYGLWVVVGSVVGTYYLLDMGFSQAVTRFVTKYIHQQRYEDANKIINTALVIYAVLGLLVLAVSCVFAFVGTERLVDEPQHVSMVQMVLLIAGLQLAIEFPSKAFPGVISAYMRFDWVAKVRTVKTIIDALLIYYFVSQGHGIIAMALVGFVTGLLSTAIYVVMVNRLFTQLKYSKSLVNKETLKGVYSFSKWVFVIDLNTMFRDKLDLWFIAYLLGASVLTVYYVAIRLVDYAITFLTQATSMTGPIFTEYYAKQQWDQLRESLIRFIKLDAFLAVTCFLGFVLVGEVFILLWMGDEFPARSAWQCLIILAAGRLMVYITSPLISLLMTFNKHRFGAVLSMVETSCVAVLCAILVPRYELIGAAVAVSLPTLVGRLVVLPWYCNRIFAFMHYGWMARLVAFLAFNAAGFTALYLISSSYLTGLVEVAIGGLGLVFVCLIAGSVLLSKSDVKEIKFLISKKKAVITNG